MDQSTWNLKQYIGDIEILRSFTSSIPNDEFFDTNRKCHIALKVLDKFRISFETIKVITMK